MPTLAAACLADVPKWGWGGEGAWQSSPQGGSLKAIQFLLPGGRQDRGEGWVGDLGFPVYSCVYSGVFSVWYPLWASLCV